MSRRSSSRRPIFPATAALILICLMVVSLIYIPIRAANLYGRPNPTLGLWGMVQYSARLLWHDGLLTRPLDPGGTERTFTIEQGEAVGTIALRLQSDGFVKSAGAFRDYVVYTGLDTSIQAGKYQLSPALSIVDVARELQDATPEDITFVVLPGWRVEEVAASLPTSGLTITPEEFIAAAATRPTGYDFFAGASSVEGFLYPGSYIIPRTAEPEEVLEILVRNFALHMSVELSEGFARQGLTVFQGVTLASLVEREAVEEQEQPIIASVFINRLNAGMKLDSDPTVQYALGYNPLQGSWWTNPLSIENLQIDSPYNTYRYGSLPPGPIASPGATSLRAVAFPAQTPYYFFRARCDDSGLHSFAETFDEHLSNACQ